MKIFNIENRNDYIETQIKRSHLKFNYSNVSTKETAFYKDKISSLNFENGPILCLGTRSGREVDLFRNHCYL